MSAKVGANGHFGQGVLTASAVNSYCLSFLAQRLAHHLRSGDRSVSANDEFYRMCLCLAKEIDFAVSHNEVPSSANDLPPVIKQVYQRRNDGGLQGAIMLVMISVKHACKSGWFHSTDTDQLLLLINEISSSFCGAANTAVEPSNVIQIISHIIPRFFPQMKLGSIIVSLEAKPGYAVLVSDFLFNKSMPVPTAHERIRLFVIRTDNMETSSCIVSPLEVSFMVNGKGVERRTNVSRDSGPQFPSDVSSLLKYGTNLIQVIGNFNGSYIIAIAYVSATPSTNAVPQLQDYVQLSTSELASDAEIIEGPSRISFKCPISHKHIKTPVKGHLCRHLQCFDYHNFIEINSRRPSWRCPHCNQPVCFPDLRIDQNMVKILKEVGEDVSDVLISADGSWNVIDEHRDLAEQTQHGSTTNQKDGLEQTESKMLQNVVDLTMEGNDDDVAADSTGSEALTGFTNQRCINNINFEAEDRKPFQDIQLFSATGRLASNGTSEMVQEQAGQMGQNIWSRFQSFVASANISVAPSIAATATTAAIVPSARLDTLVHISESSVDDAVLAPVLTDAVTPAFNRVSFDGRGASQSATASQNLQLRQFVPENLQLQQPQFENSIISNEIGRRSIPRHVSRTPIAIQALPAQRPQTQASNAHHQRTRSPVVGPSLMSSNCSSSVASHLASYVTATADGFTAASNEVERVQLSPNYSTFQRKSDEVERQQQQQQLSRSHFTPLSASDFASSSPQLHTMSQSRDFQHASNQMLQQVVGLPATSQGGTRIPSDQQRAGGYRSSSGLLSLDHRNSNNQRPPHLRASQVLSRPENLVQQSSQFSSLHGQQPIHGVSGLTGASSSTQIARPQGPPVQLQASRTIPSYAMNASDPRLSMGEQRWNASGATPVSMNDTLTDLSLEESWRQNTGRMRGSLTGRAYSAALSQLMVQPTTPSQTRPHITGPTAAGPEQLQVLITNSINAHGQPQAQLRTGDAGIPGLSIPPDRSWGM